MKLNTILRTCDKIESIHGCERFIDLPKNKLIEKCFNSLKDAIKFANKDENIEIKLTVVDDHSSEKTKNILKENCDEFIELDSHQGNNYSMMKSYEKVMLSDYDYYYLVEDDYFHFVDSIQHMCENYYYFCKKLSSKKVVLVPNNDPLNYFPDRIYDSKIVLSSRNTHWRTINNTTFTMMVHKYVLMKYWNVFSTFASKYDSVNVNEENTINTLYKSGEVYAFAPLHSLAVHINENPPHDLTKEQKQLISN